MLHLQKYSVLHVRRVCGINCTYFTGFGSSGVEHWQSLWEAANPQFKRVNQRDWEHPVCEEWVEALEKAVKEAGSEVIIVAHSLACLVVAHFASKSHRRIKAALLVASDASRGLFSRSGKRI